jgi:predicted acyltransferase
LKQYGLIQDARDISFSLSIVHRPFFSFGGYMPQPLETPSRRVVSIDALRGFDMFWITGGGAFVSGFLAWVGTPVAMMLAGQLEHAPWTGFRFEDLISPLFLFIMGASMPFSLSRRLERGDSRRELYAHIFKRVLILYMLGLIYNGLLDFQFDKLRFAGVLPRIAWTYLFAALIVMNASVRKQAVWTAALLIGYWAAMTFIPVPGVGVGSFEPNANLADYLDRFLLPGRHNSYGLNKGGDALGVLSTIPAVASVLIGVLAGHRIRAAVSPNRTVREFITAGGVLLVIGLLWDLAFPINKLLWTSSYVLFAGGWSLLLLALFYWIIDVRGYRAWAFPFVVIGMNAITIYVLHRFIYFESIAKIFVGGMIPHMGSFGKPFLAFAVMLVEWLLLYFFYRRKLFLKV